MPEEILYLIRLDPSINFSQETIDYWKQRLSNQLIEINPERKKLLEEIEEAKTNIQKLLAQKAISDKKEAEKEKILHQKHIAMVEHGIGDFVAK